MNIRSVTSISVLAAAAFASFTIAGSAFATGSRGTALDNYCAARPAGTSVPQQSRPYRASGSSCALCHPAGGGNSAGNLNDLGRATRSGQPTSGYNPFCVNAAPTGTPSITAPAAGTSVNANTSVTFTGTGGTDPDGFALTYNWSFTNGIAPAAGTSVSVTPSAAGTLTATLEVRDANGAAIATKPTRSVTVTASPPPNQAPNGSISAPATVVQGQAATFGGTGTDPDGDTVTYLWNFGANASPATSTAQNPTVTFATTGSRTVTLTVTDSRGLADPTPASVTVTVAAPPNQAPNGSITVPTNIVQGVAANFLGSATDPDGDSVSYAWNFGANATPTTSTAQNPSVVFNTTGNRTVTLTVTDSRGLADPTPAAVNVSVAAPPVTNQAPNGTITAPTGIVQGAAVTFQGSANDPNGDAVTYAWNFGANATPSTSVVQNPSVTFNTAGARTVTLTVTDSQGLADPTPASVSVTVAAPPPVNDPPNGSITTPANVVQGQAASFQGAATDPNGDAVTYAWSFGPNASPTTSTAQNPSVTFNAVGSQTVSLTVTDSQGLADPTPATATVTVAAPPPPPPPPAACTDADRDGYYAEGGICGPKDCNDNNAAINPGASEICGDGIDNDCDGATDSADKECNGTDCLARFFAKPVVITSASWDRDDSQLSVRGSQSDSGAAVTILNADSGALIGTTVARSTGSWRFSRENVRPAPCRVRVEINGQSAERSVSNAPSTCGGNVAAPVANGDSYSVVGGTTLSVPAPGVLANDTAAPGRTLSATLAGNPASGNLNLAANGGFSYAPAAGFSGTVTFTYRANDGSASSAPATVTITVTQPNQPPNGGITAPAGNVTVQQGQSVSFRGSGSDPDGNTPLSFAWDFGGAAPAATAQNPSVSFDAIGTFTVRLTVTDSKGLADPSPASVVVTVIPVPNQAPEGTILSPSGNIAIRRGATVSFRGIGSDPDGNTPLTYSWDFGGGASNSTLQNPRVRFSRSGAYTVRLTVRDAKGLADPTPATLTVRVGQREEEDDD